MKLHQAIVIGGVSLLATRAYAEETSPLTAIYDCADITDNGARLACYDNAVQTARAAEDEGEFTTITRAEVKEARKDTFGFSVPTLPKLKMPKFGSSDEDASDGIVTDNDGEISEITFKVKQFGRTNTGKIYMVFENGQTWRQSDEKAVWISKKIPPPTSASIKKASLGTFRAKLDTGHSFKVERVQ